MARRPPPPELFTINNVEGVQLARMMLLAPPCDDSTLLIAGTQYHIITVDLERNTIAVEKPSNRSRN